VRTLEIISSARVEALAFCSIASFAYLVIKVPPTPKIAIIVGMIQHKMRANFHCFRKAITKAEKNDAMAKKLMEF
jgi:hypothetical protein